MGGLKISIIATGLGNKNGWDRVARELATGLSYNGHEIQVIFRPEIGFDSKKNFSFKTIGQNYLTVLCRKSLARFLIFDYLSLRRCLKGQDVVIASYEGAFVSAYLATNRKCSLFGIIHGSYVSQGERSLWRVVYKKLYSKMEKIICVSHYTKNRFAKHFSEFEHKCEVIKSGVHSVMSEALLTFEKRKFQALMVGEVKPRKGTLYAIKALQSVPGLSLMIAGSTNDLIYLNELKQQAVACGVEDRVFFLGHVGFQDLQKLFKESLVLLMPSVNEGRSFEGFGLVHLEAYTFGTPSIGSYDSGNEEAVLHEVTGSLVSQRNSDEIAIELNSIIGSKDHWTKLSMNCLEYVKKCSWEKTVSQYESLISRR